MNISFHPKINIFFTSDKDIICSAIFSTPGLFQRVVRVGAFTTQRTLYYVVVQMNFDRGQFFHSYAFIRSIAFIFNISKMDFTKYGISTSIYVCGALGVCPY